MIQSASESLPATPRPIRCRMTISGMVQGVGFRPFVYRLANSLKLTGWVLNSTEGVVAEVEGPPDGIDAFVQLVSEQAPPRATVDRIDRVLLPAIGYTAFAIEPSQASDAASALISPDICVCEDCLRELRDPTDRRYRYPFINCTNCGPRFTIVKDVPYDRPMTAMACFSMCPACESEYHNPGDRRFHAQPNACPECGPSLWLAKPDGVSTSRDVAGEIAIIEAARLVLDGAVVAVKGLGGFHLACDARNNDAVARLRQRKRRSEKPFAVMAADASAVAGFCYVSEEERQLLESPQRPVVLLRRKEEASISGLVAPGNRFLGVMLPYTPLHHLLLDQIARQSPGQDGRTGAGTAPVLVMTSGNLSEEPIATGNREAIDRLGGLADSFVLHDRDIEVRCDDSVTRVFLGKEAIIRRSRGYAPFPVRLGLESTGLLACGAQLKNSFCITRGDHAFLSQHIGDLENAETLDFLASTVEHYMRLFHLDIAAVAHDMHPDYLSTRYATELSDRIAVPRVPVQHHHAHIAACMVENGYYGQAIGVAFDGTGYGADGNLWGGEFLVCDLAGYRRVAHLKYLPLPGGEAAIRRPCRMAASYLVDCFGAQVLDGDLPPVDEMRGPEAQLLRRQLDRGINSPLTSSAGRLFDAISSLVGLRHAITYEGQAAIELEMIADDKIEGRYDWGLGPGDPAVIDLGPAVKEIVRELHEATAASAISARFHNTVADVIATTCQRIRQETGVRTVALSGGVFQNLFLLERACRLLHAAGFELLVHHQVPANDGGVSLGQAAIASRVMSDT